MVQILRTVPRRIIEGDVHLMTAHGTDLFESTRRDTRYMIDWIAAEFGLSASDGQIVGSLVWRPGG